MGDRIFFREIPSDEDIGKYWNFLLMLGLIFLLMVCLPDYCYHDSDKKRAHEDSKVNVKKEKLMLHELEPLTLKALQELVSLVHDRVNGADQSEPVDFSSTAFREKHEHVNFMKANLSCLEDDPVACILGTLHPLTLQNVFLAMAVSLYSFL